MLWLMLLTADPASAAWPFASATNLPVCITTGQQSGVSGVPDGEGGVILGWEDRRFEPNVAVAVQRISRTGEPLWIEDGVVIHVNVGGSTSPVIAPDGVGGVVVAWLDTRNGGADIYAQHVNALGQLDWDPADLPVCTAAGDQVNLRATGDGAGGVFFVWQDYRSSPTADLYAQHVVDGQALWASNGVPLCVAANSQDPPGLASDGASGLVAVWADLRNGIDKDLYAQRLNPLGAPLWTLNGAPVSVAGNDQRNVTIVSDGYGGALVAWEDERNALNFPDIYAQHVSSAGIRLWTADGSNGIALAQANGTQALPQAIMDGSGGMIVAWQSDHDIINSGVHLYARRVSGAGVLLWPAAAGNGVTSSSGTQSLVALTPDGAGGAVLAWQDHRGPTSDVYAQRITPTGGTMWGSPSVAVSNAAGDQTAPCIVADDRRGMVVAWTDSRADAGDIYAQRIETSALLGDPGPSIVDVTDAPLDEGGWTCVRWLPSDRDTAGSTVVSTYRLWRSVPAETEPLAARRAWTSDADEAARSGKLLALAVSGQSFAWELVGEDPSHGTTERVWMAPTTGDSVADSNPITTFMTEAVGSAGQHWFAWPAFGYSVDNLPPAVPADFVGTYETGFTHLSWLPNAEPDFQQYRLYRGDSADFEPSPGNLIASPPDTGFVDPGGGEFHYKLVAVDVHGNASAPAVVHPPGITAVEFPGARGFFLAPPVPNPARGIVTLRFSVPSTAPRRLELFDVSGRRVSSLGPMVATMDEQTLQLPLVDERGVTLASGLYLLRLESSGRAITRALRVVR